MRITYCLLTVLLFTACLLAQESTKPPLISVTGTHEMEVTPDEIKVIVDIDNREKLLQLAKEKTDAQAKRLIDLAKAAKIDTGDIVTSHVVLEPFRSERKNEGRTILYFRAFQRITLTLHDFSKYDALMDSLVTEGFSEAYVQFGLSDMPAYRKKARVGAILAAQEKAKLLAESIGQTIGKAYAIKELVQTPMYGANFLSNSIAPGGDEAEDQPGSPLSVGSISVKVSVEVSFLLE